MGHIKFFKLPWTKLVSFWLICILIFSLDLIGSNIFPLPYPHHKPMALLPLSARLPGPAFHWLILPAMLTSKSYLVNVRIHLTQAGLRLDLVITIHIIGYVGIWQSIDRSWERSVQFFQGVVDMVVPVGRLGCRTLFFWFLDLCLVKKIQKSEVQRGKENAISEKFEVINLWKIEQLKEEWSQKWFAVIVYLTIDRTLSN